jgi:hypothetical protein
MSWVRVLSLAGACAAGAFVVNTHLKRDMRHREIQELQETCAERARDLTHFRDKRTAKLKEADACREEVQKLRASLRK